jgi:hypothetical protein
MTRAQLGRAIGASADETRRWMIAATMRCEAQVGYSRATIREIARTAKVIAHSVAAGVRHLVSDRQFQPHSSCKH